MDSSLVLFFVCMVTTASAQFGCGTEAFFGPFGVISSPNYTGSYENLLNCDYTIDSSVGGSVTIIFSSFHVHDSDFVTISCVTNSSFTPRQYTGHTLPDPVSIPWCSQALVHFFSDIAFGSTGFRLDYYVSEGGCGNTIFTSSSGNITSPNYPSNYDYNHNCLNIIWAPQQNTVNLSFRTFELESCCNCDFLDLRCLDNSDTLPVRFCGNRDGYVTYVYECSQVLLWFSSNGANNYPGFLIEYNVYSDDETTSVASNTTPTETSTVSNTTDFTPIVTQSTLGPRDCGETSYYGPSGVITSPNHPGSYSNDLSCDYFISASSSTSSIGIIFQAFDTEECCDFVTITCPTNSSRPSVTFSGSSLPQPFTIPWCSKGAVNFVTSSAVVSTGFSLDYHISLGGCGETVYTGSTGIVSSPNHPNNYGINQNCSNIIWASVKSSFSITFQDMNVEECCDFVELSCLDNAEYGYHRFTGTSIPPKQDIPQCTQVLIWFYSDESVTQTGFNLEYAITPESGNH